MNSNAMAHGSSVVRPNIYINLRERVKIKQPIFSFIATTVAVLVV